MRKKEKKSFADILEGVDRKRLAKLENKLPSWAPFSDQLDIPDQLCLEQCSSEATARYKAGVAAAVLPSANGKKGRIADLTGGFGVDSWFFSAAGNDVLYFERKAGLAAAVRKNFGLMPPQPEAGTIKICQLEFGDSEDGWKELADFAPNLIFADPARRDTAGRKVFLLEDCSPDITALLPRLWEISSSILLKLSPMADISMLARRLGEELKEVHIVEHGGECKELLCLLEKGHTGDYGITVTNTGKEAGSFNFRPEQERSASCKFGIPEIGMRLLEPRSALLKAGCYNLLCQYWNLEKLGRFTHLFTGSNESYSEASTFFKIFTIVDVISLNSSGIRECGRKWPEAEVSAKGLQMTSEELRKRLGVRNSSRFHIFGCTLSNGEKKLIVAES